MSIRSFVGPAGSGKTTRLMSALEERLSDRALETGQRVLAITRMHGARHRLEERLASGSARGLCDCMTMDRLAWMVAARWRDLVVEHGESLTMELDYDETCRVASVLLKESDVSRWVARRYPVVVVDEFQDCHDGRLAIVQALTTTCEVLVAADEFQDLSGAKLAPAAVWLRTVEGRVELDRVHRTSDQGLLAAADALRTGRSLQAGWRSGFGLVTAPNANVAASHLARTISWSGRGSLVVLSPTGPSKSAFVGAVLARLAEKPFEEKLRRRKGPDPKSTAPKNTTARVATKTPKLFGPYRIPWERSTEASDAALRQGLNLPSEPERLVTMPTFSSDDVLPGRQEVEQWLAHCRRIKGKTSFTVPEMHDAIGRAVQHHRAHARPSQRMRAMTIQQAKNQEFDSVIILWPFEVQGDPERLRRLLYNAVTRAKRKAVVIVQDFKGDRLDKEPFTACEIL